MVSVNPGKQETTIKNPMYLLLLLYKSIIYSDLRNTRIGINFDDNYLSEEQTNSQYRLFIQSIGKLFD